jgi:hypothetical protein
MLIISGTFSSKRRFPTGDGFGKDADAFAITIIILVGIIGVEEILEVSHCSCFRV